MNRLLKYSLILFSILSIVFIAINFLIEFFKILYFYNITSFYLLELLASLLTAFFATLIVITTAPVLRNYVSTIRGLLRLDTLSHPLLLRLQQLAPSTFQHSLMVANLAHRAAKSIGANAFLTRIGGYYHDVGKIKNSQFYMENRPFGQEDKSTLTPKQLVKKVQSHVKDGIAVAKEHKLPDEVIAFIPEHHGTLLSEGIYKEAKDKDSKVKKSDFRYPGPRPLSKETALVMLADGIETRVRSLDEHSDEEIENAVDTIIESRVKDNQIKHSGLTQNELKLVRDSFVEGAKAAFHQRKRYPDQKK